MSPTEYQHSKLQTNFRNEKPILLQKCCDGICMIVTSTVSTKKQQIFPMETYFPEEINHRFLLQLRNENGSRCIVQTTTSCDIRHFFRKGCCGPIVLFKEHNVTPETAWRCTCTGPTTGRFLYAQVAAR
jgi:hypothetical protein